MKRFTPGILALVLTMVISSTAFAGNIAGGRAAGHIPVGAAGHIAVGRAAGHIAVGRSAIVQSPSGISPELTNGTSRLDLETAISGSFAGLIRMLLESGALL